MPSKPITQITICIYTFKTYNSRTLILPSLLIPDEADQAREQRQVPRHNGEQAAPADGGVQRALGTPEVGFRELRSLEAVIPRAPQSPAAASSTSSPAAATATVARHDDDDAGASAPLRHDDDDIPICYNTAYRRCSAFLMIYDDCVV